MIEINKKNVKKISQKTFMEWWQNNKHMSGDEFEEWLLECQNIEVVWHNESQCQNCLDGNCIVDKFII